MRPVRGIIPVFPKLLFPRPAIGHSFDEHILSAVVFRQIMQNPSPIYSVVMVMTPGILPASAPEHPDLNGAARCSMTKYHSAAFYKPTGLPAPHQARVGDESRCESSRAHCCCLEM